MAISDLTGTTWELNPYHGAFNYTQYNVSLTADGHTFDVFRAPPNYEEGSEGPGITIPSMTTFAHNPNTYESIVINQDNSKWGIFSSYSLSFTENSAVKTVTFTGGTDATNATLIAWLEANATQVIAGNTYSLSNSLSNASAEDITFIIQLDEGYALPDTVTVTNGTLVSYNKATGEVVVSGASAEISVECEAVTPSGFTVTITNDTDESGWAPDSSRSEEGAYVTDASYNYVPYQSVSGNVAVFALEAGNYIAYLHNQQINSTEVTGGVVVTTGFYQEVEFTVSADGTLIIHGEED